MPCYAGRNIFIRLGALGGKEDIYAPHKCLDLFMSTKTKHNMSWPSRVWGKLVRTGRRTILKSRTGAVNDSGAAGGTWEWVVHVLIAVKKRLFLLSWQCLAPWFTLHNVNDWMTWKLSVLSGANCRLIACWCVLWWTEWRAAPKRWKRPDQHRISKMIRYWSTSPN
jgi:hypothetical protein